MDKIATLQLHNFSNLTEKEFKTLLDWMKDIRKDIKTEPSNYSDKMKYNLYR